MPSLRLPEAVLAPARRLPGAGPDRCRTQRLESELEESCPTRADSLDADTAAKPGGPVRRSPIRRGRRAVLIGTQMVAKGHHFEGVSLAAVVDADTGLGLPDFRAEERTFQLLTQLAGRSGRDAPGRCSCRPFSPTRAAHATRPATTWRDSSPAELDRRKELDYPPFRHLELDRRLRPGGRRAQRFCASSPATRGAPSCSGPRRCCVCEAVTGPS